MHCLLLLVCLTPASVTRSTSTPSTSLRHPCSSRCDNGLHHRSRSSCTDGSKLVTTQTTGNITRFLYGHLFLITAHTLTPAQRKPKSFQPTKSIFYTVGRSWCLRANFDSHVAFTVLVPKPFTNFRESADNVTIIGSISVDRFAEIRSTISVA